MFKPIVIAGYGTAWAILFVSVAMPHPASAADNTLGTYLSKCANAYIEPLCEANVSQEAGIDEDMGVACIPTSVSDKDVGRDVLNRLRDDLAHHPDIANNDSDDEIDRVITALWPCH